LVPAKVLDELLIEPYKEMTFSLADRTYGEEGGTALLGPTTLESIGLALIPFTRTLHPTRMLVMGLKK
jgi:hypothetical protein